MTTIDVPPPLSAPEPLGIAPLILSTYPKLHGIVGAQFGDLEFDVGKSVRWLDNFVDDLFIVDISTGQQRYWVVNWAETFPDSEHVVTGRNFFVSPAEAALFRKESFEWADAQWKYGPDDWVIFIDAHEGLSVDNRTLPADFGVSLFGSWIYREIERVGAGTSVTLPFFVYLKYTDLQNITYDDGVGNNAAALGIPAVSQAVAVPWYVAAQGLPRLFKVSALRNPAFNWTTLDAPVAPTAGCLLQVVSYGYAHWNIQDIPAGQTTVPALDASNDLGWQMRNLISRVRPIPTIPYGSGWQSPTAGGPATQQSIAVPSYFWVTWYNPVGGNHDWERMAATVPTQQIAIMNPNSGPDTASQPDWVRQINDARAAGLKVLGYVRTNYTIFDAASRKQQIDNYYSWYHVDGIFLDEASWEEAKQPYYLDLFNYVKAKGGTVIINPGTADIHESYMNACDIVMNYEGFASDYMARIFPSWTKTYDDKRFWHCIHDVVNVAQRDTLLAQTKLNRAGYVYLTPDTAVAAANPYDTLPPDPFWSGLVAGVPKSVGDPAGLPGPWCIDSVSTTIAPGIQNTVEEDGHTAPNAAIAGLRVPLYATVVRLNLRDGMWYERGDTGNIPLAWDETNQVWVPRYDPNQWNEAGVGADHEPPPPVSTMSFKVTGTAYTRTADANYFDFQTGFTMVAIIAPDDWTPAARQGLISKWGVAGQRSWLWAIDAGGGLVISTSRDGTTGLEFKTTHPAFTTPVDDTPLLVAASFKVVSTTNAITGVTTYEDQARFYRWDGKEFDLLQTVVQPNPAGAQIFNSTQFVQIGAINATQMYSGLIRSFSIRSQTGTDDNLGGTEVGLFRGDTTSNPSYDRYGNLWTNQGTGWSYVSMPGDPDNPPILPQWSGSTAQLGVRGNSGAFT